MYVYGNSVFPIWHGNSESGSKYVIYIPYEENFLSYRSLKGYKKKRRFNIQQLVDNGPIDIQVFHRHIYI